METGVLDELLAAVARKDTKTALRLLSGDVTLVFPQQSPLTGLLAAEAALAALHATFADIHYEPERRYAGPKQVMDEARFSARHIGAFGDVAATNNPVSIGVRLAATVREPDPGSADPAQAPAGVIERLEVWPDLPSLYSQLGVTVPGAGAAMVSALRPVPEAFRVIPVGAPEPAPRAESAALPGARHVAPTSRWTSRRLGVGALITLAFVLGVGLLLAHPGHDRSVSAGRPSASSTPTPTAPASAPATAVPSITTTNGAPKVQKGAQLSLSTDVLFTFDSAQLTPAARAQLANVAAQIRAAHVHGTVQVNGYTDNIGTAAHNKALSLARALTVARALQPSLAGVPIVLAPQGFGATNPIASNATAAGRSHNRRVTIVLPS